MLEVPQYFIVGRRPVRLVRNDQGGVVCEAFDWTSGQFSRAWEYFTRVITGEGEVERVSEGEFEEHVRQLRAEMNGK